MRLSSEGAANATVALASTIRRVDLMLAFVLVIVTRRERLCVGFLLWGNETDWMCETVGGLVEEVIIDLESGS
jgi:hypothetical protein